MRSRCFDPAIQAAPDSMDREATLFVETSRRVDPYSRHKVPSAALQPVLPSPLKLPTVSLPGRPSIKNALRAAFANRYLEPRAHVS